MTSRTSVAAQNRFIYYPDHLVRMPGPGSSFLRNVSNVLFESIFKGTISGALSEVSQPRRPPNVHDESVGSFLSRRFGPSLANNVVSAVFHGIYAGDIYKLSARTVLPSVWETEWRNHSIVKGMLGRAFGGLQPIASGDLEILKELRKDISKSDKLEAVKNSSVFTFKAGIGELASKLEATLDDLPNVLILEDTEVRQISLQSNTVVEKVRNFFFNFFPEDSCLVCAFDFPVPDCAEVGPSCIKREIRDGNSRPRF